MSLFTNDKIGKCSRCGAEVSLNTLQDHACVLASSEPLQIHLSDPPGTRAGMSYLIIEPPQWLNEVIMLRSENARLREALKEMVRGHDERCSYSDQGCLQCAARAALEGREA